MYYLIKFFELYPSLYDILKHFLSENLEVVRISKDVSGLGRRFEQVYSESKGWIEGDLTKVNPYA